MQVRVLGCSGGICQGVATTSFLIDKDILVDCGTGVSELTLEEMRNIRHIFITHSHLDHIASIPLLADTLPGAGIKRGPYPPPAQIGRMVVSQGPANTVDAVPDCLHLG